MQRVSWALTMRQFLFIPSEVGVSLHEKSHDVPGGSPSAQLLLHQAQTCHRIAFCEVTKLAASHRTRDRDNQGLLGMTWGDGRLRKWPLDSGEGS